MVKRKKNEPVARRGRPPVAGVAATERMELRLTPERLAEYRGAADETGLTLSAWAVAVMDRAVGKAVTSPHEVTRIRDQLLKLADKLDG